MNTEKRKEIKIMFWKIIFYAYLLCFVLCFIFPLVAGFDGAQRIKRDHPNAKIHKSNSGSTVAAFLRMAVLGLIPIINFAVVLYCVIHYETIVEDGMNNTLMEEGA